MSARIRSILQGFWRPAGILYLLFCLAGLSAGLWPEMIWPGPREGAFVPLPTLHCLAAAQTLFFVLTYPLVVYRRNGSGRNMGLDAFVIEVVGLFLVSLPLAIAAGWMGDATWRDGIRAGLAVAAFCPPAWLAGRLLARTPMRGGVLAVMVGVSLGLPGLYYVARDLLSAPAGWLWNLSPVLFAWSAATARTTPWLPRPLWAWLLWPVLSAMFFLLCTVRSSRPRGGP